MDRYTVGFGDSGEWIRADRLFPSQWEYRVPRVEETRHWRLHDAGQEFYDLGKALAANVVGFHFGSSAKEARPIWEDIAELTVSVGEGAVMSALALGEAEAAWAAVDGDPQLPAHWIAVRTSFLSEATQQYLMGVGHQLAKSRVQGVSR